ETNPAAGLFLGSLSCWHRYDLELINALVLDRFTGGDPWRPDDLARLSLPVGVVGMGEAADRYGGRDGVRVGRTREIASDARGLDITPLVLTCREARAGCDFQWASTM